LINGLKEEDEEEDDEDIPMGVPEVPKTGGEGPNGLSPAGALAAIGALILALRKSLKKKGN
jgi:LPXTG-motif cell wall-anchored protein